MTVSFGQLREWRGSAVGECAAGVSAQQRRLEALGAHVVASRRELATWQGQAAAAAAARHTALEAAVRDASVALAATAAALAEAAEQVAAIGRLIEVVDDVAQRHALVVTDDGVVVDLPVVIQWPDPDTAQAFSLVKERARLELRDDVERLLVRAAEVDDVLRGALATAAADALWAADPGAGSSTPGFPLAPTRQPAGPMTPSGLALVPEALGRPGWSAWDSAAWWALLTPGERERVLAESPERVGPTDGVPAWARDEANRILLQRAERSLSEVEMSLRPSPGRLLMPIAEQVALMALHGLVAAKLASVQAVKAVLGQRDGRRRQLLLLDISGRMAKTAVSTGDVDKAGHVAVYVGGLSTAVDRDLRGYDRDLGRLVDQAGKHSRSVGDRREVAAVTWMGYEAPQWSDVAEPARSVLLAESARTGAAKLSSFVNGLDASRASADTPHLTVLGHSYGSTTAGYALAGTTTGVDDLAVFGSPGLGVDDTRQLRLKPGSVHVLEAGNDIVADTGRFGRDPDTLEGADVLSAASKPLPDGSRGAGSAGHSDYLTPGSTSAWNLAAVVAGTPQLLVRGGRCEGRSVPADLSCLLFPTAAANPLLLRP